MKVLTEMLAQMHHNAGGGTWWMWMGHWTNWLLLLAFIVAVVWLLLRFSGKDRK